MLKRFLSLGLIILLISGFSPVPMLFAADTAVVAKSNPNAVIYFNPSNGESATISYDVSGGTAEELMVKVFKAPGQTWNGVCSPLSQNSIATIQGPTSQGTGKHSATWSGLTGGGQAYPAGLYCYRLTWGNPPAGLDGTLDGPMVLLSSGAGNGSGSGSGSSGSSGSGSGSGSGSDSGSGSGSGGTNLPAISASHDPAQINPYASQGNATYITYKVNENLPSGFSLKIYDSGEQVKKTLIDTNSSTLKGFGETKSWDGKDNSGNTVPAGEYFFRFKLKPNNQTVASGLINVSYTTPSSGPDITFYVSPQTFDPKQGQTTTVYYTVNNTITTGLTFEIRKTDMVTKVKTLYSTNATVNKGSASLSWDGKNSSGNIVEVGYYKVVLISGGQIIASSNVYVQYTETQNPPPQDTTPLVVTTVNPFNPYIYPVYPSPFIVTHSVSPSPFLPAIGQDTTISYTLGKTVSNFQISVKSSDGSLSRTLLSSNTKTAGSYSVSWNGYLYNSSSQLVLAPAGTYTYSFEAAYQTMVTGQVTVATYQQNAPEISNVSVNPGTIYTFSNMVGSPTSTTLSYYLSQTAHVDVVVVNSSGVTVRKLVTANYSGPYNRTAGTNSETWNGKDDFGQTVPVGTYTFYVSAHNTNGMADTKSATVNLIYGVIVDPSLLDVSNVYANPNSFNADVQPTLLTFSLNYSANVTVEITRKNDGMSVKTIGPFSSNSGTNLTVTWDGKDQWGLPAPADFYNFKVTATNSSLALGIDYETNTVQLTRNVTPPPAVLDVSNVYANPNSFNADVQPTLLTYSLNYSANVTIEITRNSDGSLIKTLTPSNPVYAGTNLTVSWDGTNLWGLPAPADVYKFKVNGVSSYYGSDSDFNYVTLTRNIVQPPANYMDVYNPYASPPSFNPAVQATYLTFSLNYPAYVTITVTRASDGSYVKTVASNEYFNSGANLIKAWNGTDQNGYIVPNGAYNFRVDAFSSSYGSDYATGSVTVGTAVTPPPSGNLVILSSSANPNSFNPKAGQTTAIKFNVGFFSGSSPSSVSVQIYNAAGTFVKTLTVSNTSTAVGNYYDSYNVYTANTMPVYYPYTYGYTATWNGKDIYEMFANDGTYTYKLNATSGSQSAQLNGYVTVSSGYTVPYPYPQPPYYGNCGGFTDVKTTNSLCAAIDFVKSKGIFAGYPDGSLGLNKVIKRAELLAVVQKAFKFSLIPYDPYYDGDLGYKDLKNQTNEWYMPYVKTFTLLGLIKGYPDGKLRPERTMNTAELYLVFLRAAKNAPFKVTNFTLQNHVQFPPYNDTPVNDDTKWYLKYAAFAKLNSLVTGNYFKPDVGITRGQVIKLIYDTYQKGLITY